MKKNYELLNLLDYVYEKIYEIVNNKGGNDISDLDNFISHYHSYEKNNFDNMSVKQAKDMVLWGLSLIINDDSEFEKRAISLIDNFCIKEYGEGISYNDISHIDIMFTEYEVEDADFEDTLNIQVYVDLKKLKICLEANKILVYQEVYANQTEMLKQLEALDFQEWTNLDIIDEYKEMIKDILNYLKDNLKPTHDINTKNDIIKAINNVIGGKYENRNK